MLAAGVEVLAPAAALGFFDGIVPVWQGNTLHQVRAERHIAATGSIEQPLMFDGNDLPGVMLSSGAQRLASLYGVRPGKAAVVATIGDRGLEAALALHGAGVAITAVADARPDGADEDLASRLDWEGIRHLPGTAVVRAFGRKQVKGVVVADLGPDGKPDRDTERGLDCDLVAVSGGTVPATSLLLQAGAKARWDTGAGAYVPDQTPEGIYAAGAVAGHESSPAQAQASGAVAGAEAALSLEFGGPEDRSRLEDDRSALIAAPASPQAVPPLGRGREREVLRLPLRGRDHQGHHLLGRGRLRLDRALEALHDADHGPLPGAHVPARLDPQDGRGHRHDGRGGRAHHRSPALVLGADGRDGGRPYEPAKRSAVHGRHRELGGNVMWAGDWRRPYDYGDARAETMAVHEGAGLIDVSTLGKLMVRGPDAGEFLNLLYPNRFDNLKPGRIRYGVLGDDAGRITDDGTVCRLDDDSFYVTTTSSGADAVEAWFAWWLAEWNLDVHLTDVSQGLAAFNLAGPRAREILSGLTDLDCSNEAFAYLDGKRALVAGVPCLLLRIGFVGELGYELHCPGSLALHLWDALSDAGERHGIMPFGLEPQRVLRLQKLHILVGQDTDAESNPLEAAMPWIVKFDKEQDFIGRWALEGVAERGELNKLVGFTLDNGAVPTEGAAVVTDGKPVGRVTSSRFSPLLQRTIGMAWVPAELGEDGTSITIADEGRRLSAQVQTAPFYDPDQEKLRG